MKKKTILFTVFALFLLVGGMGCEEEANKLFFENYILDNVSCQWRKFEMDTVIIVNTTTELEKILMCTENYPSIDFNNYSLVFAGGTAIHGVNIVVKNLYEVSDNNLILELEDRNSGFVVPTEETPWNVAILTHKLFQNTTIKLQIKK